jgi:ABC-type polar amino acid transport system ATPase subunit
MKAGLSVENLVVSYGGNAVLSGVSFRLESGQTLAIIGRSGCGKSTLLRAICALQPADRGEVSISGQTIIKDGHPLFEEWEIRRHIMMVGQGNGLIPHLTALRNITIGLEVVLGLPASETKARAEQIGEELGLTQVLQQYPEQLSAGQVQRVQLARAAVLQPDYLLLDEVTSAIDPPTIKEVTAALYRLRARMAGNEQTIVLVTHLLSFAFDFADMMIFLHDGVVYEEGVARDFQASARRPETSGFLQGIS